jgi:hypothetical protein
MTFSALPSAQWPDMAKNILPIVSCGGHKQQQGNKKRKEVASIFRDGSGSVTKECT